MLNPRKGSGGVRLSLSLRPASVISPGNCWDGKTAAEVRDQCV
jgi:hypothetical protein